MFNIKNVLFKFLIDDACIICRKKLERSNFICYTCYKKLSRKQFLSAKDNFYSSFIYEGDLRKLLIEYKRERKKYLASVLASLIEKDLEYVIKKLDIDVVIPVPLSRERLAYRGFNQISEILKILNINYEEITRTKDTKYMTDMKNVKDRKNNVLQAFDSCLGLNNKKILIVDDIVTTGSTLYEIEDMLRKKYKNLDIYFYTISKVATFNYRS